jgi:hypothetical protein
MRDGRRLASAVVVVLGLAALGWLCISRGDEVEGALRSVPAWAFALMAGLHVVTLGARSEAWRLALAAVEDRVPPRRAVHAANAGAFVAGAVASHGALPVRVVLMRRLAPDRAPRPAQIAVADAPIFLLELCLTALLLVVVTPLAGALLAATLLALLAGRHACARLGMAQGLAVLGDARRRAGLLAWVSAITACGVARVAIALAACGVAAGPSEVGAAFGALGAFGLLPLGPSAPAGATVAVAGTGGAALAAGLVLAATSIGAVLVYAAIVTAVSWHGHSTATTARVRARKLPGARHRSRGRRHARVERDLRTTGVPGRGGHAHPGRFGNDPGAGLGQAALAGEPVLARSRLG